MTDEVARALETVFAADSELYRDRGFMRRVGYGTRPALVNIDLANAWTRPGNPFSCTGMDVIVPGVQRLLAAAITADGGLATIASGGTLVVRSLETGRIPLMDCLPPSEIVEKSFRAVVILASWILINKLSDL